MSGPSTTLVDRSSATHGIPRERDARFVIPIIRNHSELVKFCGQSGPVHVNHILPHLKSYLDDEHKHFPDRTSRQDQIMTARDSTCEWLLKHQLYNSWLKGNEGLRWLEGHPGPGKIYACESHCRIDR
ncbi:nacht and ankyrin domain containing protein [Macrophomina phaseolina MS6]|uniref:Nacht and ankyrin domain containing protein n=1 Tax=Macrophomina phaseolina (strain MS6) TaxID=1126212 RepID=K2R7U3_MACPH|nr:nacht and ankyrin domain containing protein [Macrophomina phaseolina MS6]